jgi:hypothetical protein
LVHATPQAARMEECLSHIHVTPRFGLATVTIVRQPHDDSSQLLKTTRRAIDTNSDTKSMRAIRREIPWQT